MAKVDSRKKRSLKRNSWSSRRPISSKNTLRQRFNQRLKAAKKRQADFLGRRPHRSFRLTSRRDYKRSLKLPSYWSMTAQVFGMLKANWRLFLSLGLYASVLMFLFSNMMSQDTYSHLKDAVDEAQDEGILAGAVPVIALFWGVFTGQISGPSPGVAGSSEQIFGAIVGLFTWLATIWLLRSIMAGNKPKMRDGIYSSGGPVVALAILLLVILIQILPAAIAVIFYSAADASQLLDQTAILMLFGGGVILLVTLSVYWSISTLIAMVIVTLPGMYPLRALRLSGDLVVGRRTRILLRLLWPILILAVLWAAVVIPAILVDGAIKSAIPGLGWLPIVPTMAMLMMVFSIIFMASYTYIFYRKVVEDDSAPA